MGRWVHLLAIVIFVGCSYQSGYNHFEPISERGWTTDNVIHFKPDLADSVSRYDLSIDIRHTENYPFQNLTLVVAFKEGTNVTLDTLNLLLADERGRWKSRGNILLRTYSTPYRHAVHFPSGTCAVSVRHDMNVGVLKGITNIGLTIRKSED